MSNRYSGIIKLANGAKKEFQVILRAEETLAQGVRRIAGDLATGWTILDMFQHFIGKDGKEEKKKVNVS